MPRFFLLSLSLIYLHVAVNWVNDSANDQRGALLHDSDNDNDLHEDHGVTVVIWFRL